MFNFTSQSDPKIFRPWDTEEESGNTPSTSPSSDSSNDDINVVTCDLPSTTERLHNLNINEDQSSSKLHPYLHPFEYNNIALPIPACSSSPTSAALSRNLYYSNPGLHVQAAYPIDSIALGFYEQGLARVMAEEAQNKALNARKQRPKKFKCPHCDVAFSNNGQLRGHIRIHTGERPFKCEICEKTFTRNEELTRHKRIHSGIRPFDCTTCGKKFGRRDHLKKHMKTHEDRFVIPTPHPAIYMPLYHPFVGYSY